MCIFTLAVGGVCVDLHVKYVHEQNTQIHERTYARLSKLRRLRKTYAGVKINHQKDGAAHARYGRRNSRRILRRLRKRT